MNWRKHGYVLCTLYHIFNEGSFLDPLTSMKEYELLKRVYMRNPAMEEYCSHGNRFLLWMPYRGWEGNTENVTYGTSDDGEQLAFPGAWRTTSKVPTTSARPWCVVAQLGTVRYFL